MPAAISVTLAAATIDVGSTTQASAVVRDASGATIPGASVAWTVVATPAGSATISAAGLVAAVAAGTATITASVNGASTPVSGSAQLTMRQVPTTVSVTLAEATINVGATTQASAVVRDAAGATMAGASVTWTIAATPAGSATVSATGLVTAVGAGTATITASVTGAAPPVSGSAQLTVRAVPTTVTVSLASSAIVEKKTTQATAIVRDASGAVMSGVAVTWTATGTLGATASVGSDGLVTAQLPGTVTITATVAGTTPPVTGSAQLRVHVLLLSLKGGVDHTCARSSIYQAPYCWGGNSVGQVGDGTTNNNRLRPTLATVIFSVVNGVVTTAGIDLVSAGHHQSCALWTTSGAAYCWGFNGDGQLGDGTTTDRPRPTRVTGGPPFKQIVTDNATCALTAAGAAWCWGYNSFGQLGDGTTISRSVPGAVSGGLTFAGLAMADNAACGWSTAGQAYCWGVGYTPTPTAIQGGFSFVEISAGGDHACGRTALAVTACWGNNTSGELGDNTTTARFSSAAVVAGGHAFAQLATGYSHSCGRTLAGLIYCWGSNDEGQLGDGTTTNRLTPTLVSGGLVFDQVGAGDLHTCGRTTAFEWFCWGRNSSGQLGDGTTTQRLTPARVLLP